MNEPSRLSRALHSLNVGLILSGLLELLGIAAIAWGFYLIAPCAGFIAGGVGLLWVAKAIDPPQESFLRLLLNRPPRAVKEEF